MDPVRTGVGEYTYEFLNELFKIDKQNKYYLFYNSLSDVSANIPKWQQDNVEIINFKYPNKLFNFSLQFFKYPKLDKMMPEKIDYFFSPNINFSAFSSKVKQILTIHDLSFEYFEDCFYTKQKLWHKIINPKKLCQNASIILTPSENTKNDIIETYKVKKNKINVIYPGLSSIFLQETKISEESIKLKYNLPENFILFLGTVEPRKNIIGLIKAFEKTGLKNKDYELIVAGSMGSKNTEVKKMMENTANVRYIGYIDSADKPMLYKLAKVFAYPSLYEGFGFPVLEAMAVGTPVLTSNRSSLTEVVGNSGYLVNPTNIYEITEGILKLVEDKELGDYFSNKAIERSKRFRWRNTAENFLQLLNINYE